MRRNDRNLSAETELMRAIPPLHEKRRASEDCPDRKLLKSFLNGKVHDKSIQNRILHHLDDCSACVQTLRELRDGRIRVKRALLAVAAVVLAGVLIWIWPSKHTATEIATLDLDGSGVLRSVGEPPLRLPRSTKRLHIILPGEERPGLYEVRLLKSQDETSPLVEGHGIAHLEKQHLELDIDFDIAGYAGDNYLLAIRHSTATWRYRPVQIE
jgi:hypothetical protein